MAAGNGAVVSAVAQLGWLSGVLGAASCYAAAAEDGDRGTLACLHRLGVPIGRKGCLRRPSVAACPCPACAGWWGAGRPRSQLWRLGSLDHWGPSTGAARSGSRCRRGWRGSGERPQQAGREA